MEEKKEQEDNSREGINFEKFIQLFKLFLPKNTKTLAKLDKFSDLDLQKINSIKNLDIKGLIVDVDDCIAENHGEILEENIAHINKLLSQGFKIVFYSNMKKTDRYNVLPNIEILTNLPPKPNIEGFKIACSSLSLNPKNVVMVGDSYITDSGALRLGIQFIRIKPIKTKYKKFFFWLIMIPYRFFRWVFSIISDFHDLFRRQKPLKSKDLK